MCMCVSVYIIDSCTSDICIYWIIENTVTFYSYAKTFTKLESKEKFDKQKRAKES